MDRGPGLRFLRVFMASAVVFLAAGIAPVAGARAGSDRAVVDGQQRVVVSDPTRVSAPRGRSDVPLSIVVSDRFVIRWSRDLSAAQARSAPRLAALSRAAGMTARFVRLFQSTSAIYRLSAPLGARADATLSALARVPGVAIAEPDGWVTATTLPNDPDASQLWGLLGPTDGSSYGVDALGAWPSTKGSGVTVAVLDTGLVSHPDLAGQSVGGYDFVSGAFVANDGDGWDPDPSDPGDWISSEDISSGGFGSWTCPIRDSSWHGTHVTGTIAALADNSVGVFGGAPEVSVEPVRVLGKCGGWASDFADGITWASGGSVAGVPDNPNPARILNLSLGGQRACTSFEEAAISDARSRGSVVVVSAGNSSTDAAGFAPANCPGALTVAATDSAGLLASFSNNGAVDIAAPGVSILSTFNTGTTVPEDPSYHAYDGTSMAAPHVALAAALVAAARPALTPDEIEAALVNGATAFPVDPNGGCSTLGCGAGIVNATAALTAPVAIAPVVTVDPTDQTADEGTLVSFTASASGVPAPTVQWEGSSDGGVTWNLMGGATSETYSFTAILGDSGNRFRAVFTNSAGTATSAAATLTVISTSPPPAVTSISPSSGPASGGTIVTITGSGFTGATQVRFGAAPAASFAPVSDSSIRATSPTGTGTVDVTVTGPGGTSPPVTDDLFTFQPISPPHGGTLYVALTPKASGGGSCAAPDYNSVDLAVAAASAGGTIHICAGTYDLLGTLFPGGDIAFVGDGSSTTILDAGGTHGIVDAIGWSVSVTDLTLRDGAAGADGSGAPGGAISADVVTATDSVFSGNSASTNNGGAIFAQGLAEPAVTVTGSTFDANTANGSGGAIYSLNGGVAAEASTFTGNDAATGGYGGAISAPSVTVTDSTFEGNSAVNGGGAIAGNVQATGSTFSGNTAVVGGAIDGFTIGAANTTFAGNKAFPVTVEEAYGGAIHGVLVTVTNVTFSGNAATDGGGALSTRYGGLPTITLTNTILAQASTSDNCDVTSSSATFVDGGGNLSTDGTCGLSVSTSKVVSFSDLALGALASNGGPTQTVALGPGSVAIDAGLDAVCAAVPVGGLDQRGVPRPQGAHCDAGAFELASAPTVTSISPALGPEAGGTSVAIAGTGLVGVTEVRFGATAATSFSVAAGGTITAVSPPGSGAVHVTVAGPAGTSAPSSADLFTYVPTPIAVTVLPADPTIPSGTDRQFTATASFTDGSTVDVTASAAWASSSTSVATIGSGDGLAHGVSAGSTTITATFAGVSGSTTLTVGGPLPILTYTGDTNATPGSGVTLSATLIDQVGQGLGKRTITFQLGEMVQSATTNRAGYAYVKARAPSTVGGYPIGISFAGDPSYSPVSVTSTLVVRLATKLVYTGGTKFPAGSPVVLTAVLQDGAGAVLAGQGVTFAIEGRTFSATTDQRGVATVEVGSLVSGRHKLQVNFAGDVTYAPSSTTVTLTVR